jgi:hypothetical protein
VSAKQHVPLGEYAENLKKIIKEVRDQGISNIILITPPPVYEPGRKEAQVQVG